MTYDNIRMEDVNVCPKLDYVKSYSTSKHKRSRTEQRHILKFKNIVILRLLRDRERRKLVMSRKKIMEKLKAMIAAED